MNQHLSHPKDASARFEVAGWIHWLGGLIERHPRPWIGLGNLESRLLADTFEDVHVDRPVFICGLARAGSTILLELLAKHPAVGTHRYVDYPPVFTPLLWGNLRERMASKTGASSERSHGDGIEVNASSPEAMEEPIWMAFFDHVHDPSSNNVLDADTDNPAFERFYREHVRKILASRVASRYVSKGNYNISRMRYLLRLFPDARFVVPIRGPSWHIASLMKQHALFCDGETHNPRALDHMRRTGHFEFGLDRRPVSFDSHGNARDVLAYWQAGDEVRGWALYWNQVHAHIYDCLRANPALHAATMVVRHEDLCGEPRETLGAVFAHCRLGAGHELIRDGAARLRLPNYYRPTFDARQRRIIEQYTGGIAQRLGYK